MRDKNIVHQKDIEAMKKANQQIENESKYIILPRKWKQVYTRTSLILVGPLQIIL